MDGVTNYKVYYNEKLQEGLEYQDFITDLLINELGISLSSYSSKKFQNSIGENRQGFEIKFDNRMIDTGNIYIEVKEKSNPDNANYVDSGIFRNDNTWLYLIGNYDSVYIFGKKHLILMYEKNTYKQVTTSTSIGFLLPVTDAEKYCLKKLILKVS
jgi:hypothetical protein